MQPRWSAAARAVCVVSLAVAAACRLGADAASAQPLAESPGALVASHLPSQAAPVKASAEARAAGQRAFDAVLARNWNEAEKLAEEALLLAQQQGDEWAEGLALRLRGTARAETRRPDEAIADLQRAREILSRAGDPRQLGYALRSLGDVVWEHGRRDESGPLYEASADAFHEAGLPLEEASSLRSASFAPASEGQRLRFITRAWALVEPLPAASVRDRRIRGAILHQWGDYLFGRGDYAGAVAQYERALPWLEQDAASGNALAALLTSLGRVQRAHGYAERALPYYVRALGLQRGAGDQYGEMQSLNAIGVTLRMLSRLPEALETLQQARALAVALGNPRARAYIDGSLGVLRFALGDASAAVDVLTRVRAELGEPDSFVSSGFAETLAMSHLALGQLDETIATASAALETWTQRDEAPPAVIGVLMVRAVALQRQGRTEESLRDAREAVERRERLRERLVPLDFLKRGALDAGAGFQDLAVELYSELGQPAEAMAAAELGRARALLDLMATYSASSTVPPEALEAARRVAVSRAPATGLAPPADAGTVAPAAGERGGAASQSPAARLAEPVLASSANVRPPGAAEIATLASRLDTAVLSYWVTGDTVYTWVVGTDGQIHGATRPCPRAHLERLVRDASASAVRSGGGRGQLAESGGRAAGGGGRRPYRALYDLLVAPVEAWLPREAGARVTVVPHGPLFRVAFAALMDARGRYLVERFSLRYTPSLGVLALPRARREAAPGGYLVIADPSPLPRGLALPRLAGARREARDIAALGRRLGIAVTTLEGAAASEPAVRTQTKDREVVHFAAHGLVRDDTPFESFLALGATGSGGQEDGRLTAAELYDLSLSADLVVLSACRSADGRVSGDGIVGLTRGFLAAGAQSVIASLWDLPDETARALLPEFYRAWSRRESKADALRAAQLHLLRSLRSGQFRVSTPAGQFALPEHPSLWAGLVLFGDD